MSGVANRGVLWGKMVGTSPQPIMASLNQPTPSFLASRAMRSTRSCVSRCHHGGAAPPGERRRILCHGGSVGKFPPRDAAGDLRKHGAEADEQTGDLRGGDLQIRADVLRALPPPDIGQAGASAPAGRLLRRGGHQRSGAVGTRASFEIYNPEAWEKPQEAEAPTFDRLAELAGL